MHSLNIHTIPSRNAKCSQTPSSLLPSAPCSCARCNERHFSALCAWTRAYVPGSFSGCATPAREWNERPQPFTAEPRCNIPVFSLEHGGSRFLICTSGHNLKLFSFSAASGQKCEMGREVHGKKTGKYYAISFSGHALRRRSDEMC